MKGNSWIRGLVAVMLLAGAGASPAQVVIRKPAGQKVRVNLAELQTGPGAAQVVRRTLEMNLSRSGWMDVAPAGQGEIKVRGSISETGGQVFFTCQVLDAAGQAYINGTYSQPAAQAVYLAHHVANDIVQKVTGKPTFFLARLVMIGVRGNGKELFLADSSAQDIRQLTQDNSIAIKPRWSPDNRLISYTSYLKRYPDVYTIELATGNRQRVAAFPGVNSGGAISPDGQSMALILSKDGNPDLYVMDLGSKRLTRLTHTPRATEGSPCWSPDGQRIAYVSDTSGTPQIYLISHAGGSPERLTVRGAQNVAPDWSKPTDTAPNGLLAYQTLSGGKFQIAIMDPAIKEERIITPFDASYEDPSWAPDGRHIAAARGLNYKYSIYLLDTMGDKPVALTTTSGEWSAPAWSR